jgi:hypothetical protein
VSKRTPRIGVGPHRSPWKLFGDVAVRKFGATKKRNRESGYGLVFAAIGLIALLGAAGLSVDMGYFRYQRRLLQSAADSAALAGAAQLGAGGGTAQAQSAALDDSSLNGFKDGGDIHVTPTPITLNGNTNTMQVTVANTYDTFFMRIFGGSLTKITVSTKATAQYLGGRGCIYALTGGNGITVTGNVDVPNCNVISNQNITVNGGASLTAAAVGANGTASNRRITPAAITPTQQSSDPLSYLPTQDTNPAGCQNGTLTSADNKAGSRTFFAGKYCSFSFAARTKTNPGYTGNVKFNAGTYVITSGGLSFQGSGQVAGTTGNGVTFYVGAGSVAFSANQQIQLTASKVGQYAGVLIVQPTGNNNTATVNGKNGSFLQGALYFPNAILNVNGAANNKKIDYMIFVAKTLNLGTNINFPSDYGSLQNGLSPVRTASLVE